MLTQNVCEPSRCLDPSRIMIQAENNLLQLWILFQHPEHGVFRCTTERHIAVLLPVLWVQSKKSQQINRCFEHIEPVTGPSPVKAVSGIASFYIATVALALRIDASFVGVAGNAMFIDSDEYGIMIHSNNRGIPLLYLSTASII